MALNPRNIGPTMSNLKSIVDVGKYTILDVRPKERFAMNTLDGAYNIPLDRLDSEIPTIKTWQTPLLVCCEAGISSGKAVQLLNGRGIESYNAGGWRDVIDLLKNKNTE